MRVLHSAFMIGDEPGVMNQMAWEQEIAKSLGLEWDSRLYCPSSSALSGPILIKSHLSPGEGRSKIFGSLVFWLKFRKNYYRWLKDQAVKYDVILLRHSKYDPFRPSFIKNSVIPVFTVHHTLELSEIRQGDSWVASLKAIAESFWGARGIRYSRGVIGVTQEIVEHQVSRVDKAKIESYIYPNGITLDDKDISAISDRRSADVPEILFVASYFSPWHGLDRLLNTLSKTNANFVLHLVGRVSDANRLLALGDPRVRFHGLCTQNEILELSERSWVGLSSFALDRISMRDACTLKVREYLSQGLPVYSGYNDVFPEGFASYRKGPPDIGKILEYAMETRCFEKRVVAESALPLISKKVLVEKFSKWLIGNLKV